ncbi:MAG: nucleoside triphosphate pyrophosphohydrolase [Fimbriimonadaceae bacterium]
MPESIESILEKQNLTGPYQVHISPHILVIDQRAHQIFRGFQNDFQTLLDHLNRSYQPQIKADPTDLLIIPALDQEHPGGLAGLVHIVDRLVGPGGCPWDQAQTHESLKKYLLEESYELIEAIDNNDELGMQEELGDVLLQPLMHTQIKRLEGRWGVEEVASQINAKLIRRHPHVFGNTTAETPEEVLKNWDKIKRQEKSDQFKPESTLSGVPKAMPALMLAMEISKRAARSGFEWPSFDGVWDKFHEEESEFKEALQSGDKTRISDELGDLLFTVVNLARWAKIDPEDALRTMVERFRRRFITMESLTSKPLGDLNPEEWDQLWNQAKIKVH